MATVEKKSTNNSIKKQFENVTYQEPKRLSKIGQWMLDNPHGICEVKDWRAVNK